MLECSRFFKIHQDTIKNNLIKYKIPIISDRRHRNKCLVFSKKEKEFISGCLLGDAHISRAKGKSSEFRYNSSHKDHTFFIYKFLAKFSAPKYKKGPVKVLKWDRRTKKEYTSYKFRTISNISFFDLRNKWYPDEIKKIPEKLILTHLTCLLWYIGDGGILKGKRTQEIKLSTHCFNKTDIEKILLPQLKKFNARIKNMGKNQYVIIIPKIKTECFLKFIGKCPIKSYTYKWGIIPYKNRKFKNGLIHKTNNEEIAQFYKLGNTYYKIAKEFKIEPSLVRYYLIKIYIRAFK